MFFRRFRAASPIRGRGEKRFRHFSVIFPSLFRRAPSSARKARRHLKTNFSICRSIVREREREREVVCRLDARPSTFSYRYTRTCSRVYKVRWDPIKMVTYRESSVRNVARVADSSRAGDRCSRFKRRGPREGPREISAGLADDPRDEKRRGSLFFSSAHVFVTCPAATGYYA